MKKFIIAANLFLFQLFGISVFAQPNICGCNGQNYTLGFQGPTGGDHGDPFTDCLNIPPRSHVSRIVVQWGDFITSIQLFYPEGNSTDKHGDVDEDTKPKSSIIDLASDEYITGISGTWGNYIDGMLITTNKATYGRDSKNNVTTTNPKPFGGGGSNKVYNIQANNSEEIIGFFGRSGKYLDAIGILTRPIGSTTGCGNYSCNPPVDCGTTAQSSPKGSITIHFATDIDPQTRPVTIKGIFQDQVTAFCREVCLKRNDHPSNTTSNGNNLPFHDWFPAGDWEATFTVPNISQGLWQIVLLPGPISGSNNTCARLTVPGNATMLIGSQNLCFPY